MTFEGVGSKHSENTVLTHLWSCQLSRQLTLTHARHSVTDHKTSRCVTVTTSTHQQGS